MPTWAYYNTFMNRFEQETPSSANAMSLCWDGPDGPALDVEEINCDGCNRNFPLIEMSAVDDGTQRPLFLCPTCKAEENNDRSECICMQLTQEDDPHSCRACYPRFEPIRAQVVMPNIPEWKVA